MDYDVGVIGAGVSGAEKYKNIKAIVFEYGPPPQFLIGATTEGGG